MCIRDSSDFLAWASDGSPTVPQVQAEQDITLASNQQGPCTATSISPSSDAASPDQSLTVTASAQCPAGAGVEYSYFVRSGASGSWTLEAAWIGPSWSWSVPAVPGLYQVLVWASDGPYTCLLYTSIPLGSQRVITRSKSEGESTRE